MPPKTSQAPAARPEFQFPEVVQGPVTHVEYKPGTLMTVVTSYTAEPEPCVVILHGHNVEPAFYSGLAKAIMARGAAVFVPDWDDTLPSDKDPRTMTITDGLDDVADAMRFIRLYADRYGGDPNRIVIVGHSLGAVVALTAMFAGDVYGTRAFPRDVNALPDGYVSLDGVVPFRELLWADDLRRLYDEDPATWDKLNPETYLRDADVRRDVEFRFFVATLDYELTSRMAQRMRRLGHRTVVERVNVGHMQAAEPQTDTIEAIIELAHPD